MLAHKLVRLNNATLPFIKQSVRAAVNWYERDRLKTPLTWVLLCSFHASKTDTRSHLTIRGFDNAGYARQTMHVYLPAERTLWNNGGRRFRAPNDPLDLKNACRML